MKKRKRTKIKSKKEKKQQNTMEKWLMIYGLSNGFEDLR